MYLLALIGLCFVQNWISGALISGASGQKERRISLCLMPLWRLVIIMMILVQLEASWSGAMDVWPLKNMSDVDLISQQCISPIYCNGTVLRTIQEANLFTDSKRFVDMPSKFPEDEIIHRFNQLGTRPTEDALDEFIKKNFEPPGHELLFKIPKDWKSNVTFLNNITIPKLKNFASIVHGKWKGLVRKVDTSKICDGCASSVIPLPMPFVVPGGRFRELYYWDSFWILEGLYVSEMCTTAAMTIENFKWLVKTFGFIPNGSRTYYLSRSQPPLFTMIVKRYVKECIPQKDHNEWLRNILPYLDQEYMFWKHFRSVNISLADGTMTTLNRYRADSELPRPESYLQDVTIINEAMKYGKQERHSGILFREISSAAESGLDFTERWFEQADKTDQADNAIPPMQALEMIPVELNSILYQTELTLSNFHTIAGNANKGIAYQEAGEKRLKSVNSLLWNGEKEMWIDYDHSIQKSLTDRPFYSTNLAPLWYDAHNFSNAEVELILMKHWKIIAEHPGGIPYDEEVSGQQWDYPNVWAPIQYYFVELLERVANRSEGRSDFWKEKALDIAQRFISSTYCGYQNYGQFFEKYNAQAVGQPGGGGEYIVQEGFGWTNGVILWLMKRYGEKLKVPECALVVKAKPEKDKEIQRWRRGRFSRASILLIVLVLLGLAILGLAIFFFARQKRLYKEYMATTSYNHPYTL